MLFRQHRAVSIITPLRLISVTSKIWAGHSKWANIKHDKAKNDAERTKIFSKFANQIAVAVKLGGTSDPSQNIRLATAIELANKNNVTKKVIENAIKKGAGISCNKDGGNVESCTYEGIGPGGIAFVVEALTDNKNRTVGMVRGAFNKFNGSMSPTLYFFDKKGYIITHSPKELDDFEKVFEKVLDIYGVNDLELCKQSNFESLAGYASETYEISTEPTETNKIATHLKNCGFYIKEVSTGYSPKSNMLVEINNQDIRIKFEKLMAQLDDIDDVTDIYTNIKE